MSESTVVGARAVALVRATCAEGVRERSTCAARSRAGVGWARTAPLLMTHYSKLTTATY